MIAASRWNFDIAMDDSTSVQLIQTKGNVVTDFALLEVGKTGDQAEVGLLFALFSQEGGQRAVRKLHHD